jgi:hypothetical protein
VSVLVKVTGAINRRQNVRQLPLLDRAGDNLASCRAKNTPFHELVCLIESIDQRPLKV